MKIINPNNTTHTIVLQPRFKPTNALVLELTNKVTKVVSVVDNTYIYSDGTLSLDFDFDFLEGDKFTIVVKEKSITNDVLQAELQYTL